MTAYPSVRRGLVAVAVLLLTAADALLTAAVGIPPVAWCARRIGAVVREAYRLGRFGEPSTCRAVELHITDAEIVDDEETGR